MPSSLRCVQYMVTSILQDQQYMFGVKSLLMVEKVLLMRNNLVAVLFRPMQRSQQSIPSCGQTGVWCVMGCLHEYGRYVEKWNINVWRLNTFVCCWTCSLFSFNSQCSSTLASCKRKLLGKILHWLTKYKWRHSNDVIITIIPVYIPN